MQQNELQLVNNTLSTLSIKGLSMDDIMKVISLTDEVQKKFKLFISARKKIFESYGVKDDNDLFKHPEFKEISDKIRELDEDEVGEILGAKFLEAKDFQKVLDNNQGINITGAKFLKELLLKN